MPELRKVSGDEAIKALQPPGTIMQATSQATNRRKNVLS